MTPRTRRLVVLSLVVIAITLPVEMVLLKTLSASDEKTAAANWVESLSGEELHAAAADIQGYPFVYRKEIMRALAPAWRSATWRGHIQQYLDDHPGLSPAAVAVLNEIITVLSTEAMGNPNSTLAAQVADLGVQLEALLGHEEADYLLHRLGPPDELIAAHQVPLLDRLASRLRGLVVAMARLDDCECSTSFGCDTFLYCSDEVACEPDTEWPACGWGWFQDCDGICVTGQPGGN